MVSFDPTAGGAVDETRVGQPVFERGRSGDRRVTKWSEWATRNGRPWVATAVVLVITVFLLRLQGRLWTCACGSLAPWAGNVWSTHNSQHLFDPYSFTHILHGILLCGLLAWVVPRLSPGWRLFFALVIESLWEVVENSELVIQRYREATLALGYEGDTVLNSMGDIFSCLAGLLIARWLGLRWSIALFVAIEVLLLFWIRDNLTLNVVMLIHPIDAIKDWQLAH